MNIAAGEFFDSSQFELGENWNGNGPQPVLRNRETGEETRLKMPKEADWSFLNHSLPNMKKALASLEGLDYSFELEINN